MANFSIENDCSLIPLDMSAVIQSVTSSFRTGAELINGQPTKSSCQSARYFSRSFALTHSQYAFSKFQTWASSLAEFCANAAVVSARRIEIVFNIARSYFARRTIAIALRSDRLNIR